VQFETEQAAKRACQLHGTDFMGRELTIDVSTSGVRAPSGKPVEGCWFCLSNPNADVNLVASIGKPPCLPCCCACSQLHQSIVLIDVEGEEVEKIVVMSTISTERRLHDVIIPAAIHVLLCFLSTSSRLYMPTKLDKTFQPKVNNPQSKCFGVMSGNVLQLFFGWEDGH
jgi:hypothetical protein